MGRIYYFCRRGHRIGGVPMGLVTFFFFFFFFF